MSRETNDGLEGDSRDGLLFLRFDNRVTGSF